MGLSLSLLLSAWKEILDHRFFGLKDPVERVLEVRSLSFKRKDGRVTSRTNSFKKEGSETDRKLDHEAKMERSLSFRNWEEDSKESETEAFNSSDDSIHDQKKSTPGSLNGKNCQPIQLTKPRISVPEPVIWFSPKPVKELDAAATKLQKVYKSYRTRRNLADCAVVVEELWWKTVDAAFLKQRSIEFFDIEKHETAISKWSRAGTRIAKVGKGLSKDEKAQQLAHQHWLEAIDPRHRYGHNLGLYYDVWSESKSTQPFFYWLDIGDGKDVNLEKCSRSNLQRQSIRYLGPKEREEFEVIVESGKLMYKQSGFLVNTTEDFKWIFVLSTSRALYIGKKKKGCFQHSSFLSGAATTAAGRLVAYDGVLKAIWPYSGHYRPTEDHFKEFINFLEEHHVDLTEVKRCSINEDYPSFKSSADDESKSEECEVSATEISRDDADAENKVELIETESKQDDTSMVNAEVPVFNMAKRLSCKWSSGVGPRIGCVRDYPMELQAQALEQVNLSPRVTPGSGRLVPSGPIPSPRPSPKIKVSPRLAYMGIPSPRIAVNA